MTWFFSRWIFKPDRGMWVSFKLLFQVQTQWFIPVKTTSLLSPSLPTSYTRPFTSMAVRWRSVLRLEIYKYTVLTHFSCRQDCCKYQCHHHPCCLASYFKHLGQHICSVNFWVSYTREIFVLVFFPFTSQFKITTYFSLYSSFLIYTSFAQNVLQT